VSEPLAQSMQKCVENRSQFTSLHIWMRCLRNPPFSQCNVLTVAPFPNRCQSRLETGFGKPEGPRCATGTLKQTTPSPLTKGRGLRPPTNPYQVKKGVKHPQGVRTAPALVPSIRNTSGSSVLEHLFDSTYVWFD